MNQVGYSNALGAAATEQAYRSEQTKTNQTQKKTKVSGRTIGDPVLSEKAAKYYEKLRAKYSNMDFVLVSPEKKAEAESQKGMYQSSKALLVLIDSDKIERMAEDEAYRNKYEAILNNATSQISQMKAQLITRSSNSSVRSIGMSFDDHGNASFFAVVDKSLKAQRERIDANRQKKAEEKKADAKKKAANEAREKQAEAVKSKKADETDASDTVTVTANSLEELLQKIDEVYFAERADSVMTEEEKALGGFVNYVV